MIDLVIRGMNKKNDVQERWIQKVHFVWCLLGSFRRNPGPVCL